MGDVLLPLSEKIKEQVNFERVIIVPFSTGAKTARLSSEQTLK